MVCERIPAKFGLNRVDDVQVLSPMQRGTLGCRNLNAVLQEALNPTGPAIQRYGWTFRVGDKVMQMRNDYDKDVFNGDIGRVAKIDEVAQEMTGRFDDRPVKYDFNELDELHLSYATTVHKSQGSEYPVVVLPIHTQHYLMLQRGLLHTAVTRARKLVVLVGTLIRSQHPGPHSVPASLRNCCSHCCHSSDIWRTLSGCFALKSSDSQRSVRRS
jgi:exodeoxyribonuclease V alpha subunit